LLAKSNTAKYELVGNTAVDLLRMTFAIMGALYMNYRHGFGEWWELRRIVLGYFFHFLLANTNKLSS